MFTSPFCLVRNIGSAGFTQITFLKSVTVSHILLRNCPPFHYLLLLKGYKIKVVSGFILRFDASTLVLIFVTHGPWLRLCAFFPEQEESFTFFQLHWMRLLHWFTFRCHAKKFYSTGANLLRGRDYFLAFPRDSAFYKLRPQTQLTSFRLFHKLSSVSFSQ